MMKETDKAKKTRAQILQAALELFYENGFEKTTLRDVAKKSGMALGATYYYFHSKEEMVFEFYAQTHEEALVRNALIVSESTKFQKRLKALIDFKFEQLMPYRPFIGALARFAANPSHPLSPFSQPSKPYRDQAIAMFEQIIEGSDIKIPSPIKHSLPTLLWAYQMALTLFWINDSSAGQEHTKSLADFSQKLITKWLTLSRLPLLHPFLSSVDTLVRMIQDPGSPPR
ncbi:MAG: TetR family transcriptional regulator [Deltaproteobacteria bacterium]|nr:TetR family transcriptional regulator [Deltaproteobacteria bacterium]